MKPRYGLSAFGVALGMFGLILLVQGPLWAHVLDSLTASSAASPQLDAGVESPPDSLPVPQGGCVPLAATFVPLDEDKDGYFEALVMNAEVPLPNPGEYVASAGMIVPDPEFPRSQREIGQGRAPGELGPRSEHQKVRLRSSNENHASLQMWFDGEDIRTCGSQCPPFVWLLVLSSDPNGSMSNFSIAVPTEDTRRFGYEAAHIADVQWNPHSHTAHALVVRVDVDHGGQFKIAALVARGGQGVASAAVDTLLGEGFNTLEIPWKLDVPSLGLPDPWTDEITVLLSQSGRQLGRWHRPFDLISE